MRSTGRGLRAAAGIVLTALAGCGFFTSEKSVFDTRSAVHSPHGSVSFGAKAYSPDDSRYARETSPEDAGNIGVFSLPDSVLVQFNALDSSCTNNLKGLAWSPDSRHLAVMYHGGMKPGIYMYGADSGVEERYIGSGSGSGGYYHYMVFDSSGAYVLVSVRGHNIDDSLVTGLK